ncbi:hypothetical protein SZ47_13370 [Brachyspira hyodysenteriae]|uniref:DUF4253 domain-containing protein n=1 Tax=Brachyspira hyodysenteriae ATCC 27164 TaxID=1266923 RepID=A0A3B6VWE7_BRAHO|nr:DUF4253 domain-containing protein [Brachyspira hyodysenteriae]ANN62896.1 hypothetical protein BHYOB78_03175 [Brachyspira hyodysenteriae ATCC 27164]KLI22258.1 hypothetical protein SZ47_13370 [Brachyspira hyodysenteriae]MCZ9926039.1 DUF4253 domain-containing protein [Brachyspira hyodysenteriae]
MNEDIKFITDFLKCDYEILEGGLEDDTKIMECYKEHLEKGKKEGYTPLIIIPTDTLTEAIEIFLEDNDAEIEDSKKLINEYIEKSKEVNYKDYLHQNIEDIYDDKEYIEEIKKSFNAPIVEGFEVIDSFGSYYDYTLDDPVTVDLILAKITTNNPYELACYIPMGGFNDCPNPETQAAIFKYWYEKYNAYPAVVGYDIWELWIEKHPQTEEEARELAIEHYYFCLDRVDQYSENYDHGKLAGTLLKSDVWYFWWD